METSTFKIDKGIKQKFEETFEAVHKTKPSTTEYIETILSEKTEELERELNLKKAKK